MEDMKRKGLTLTQRQYEEMWERFYNRNGRISRTISYWRNEDEGYPPDPNEMEHIILFKGMKAIKV